MKTAFFTQNIKRGGLDTFLVNLIRYWPQTDHITVFCNRSHPGLPDIRARVPARVEVVPYDFLIAQDINARFAGLPAAARFAIRALFGLLGLPYMMLRIGRLFRRYRLDRLMVVNGSYPGGDACIAATIAWARRHPDRPAWHNFHNLAVISPHSPVRTLRDRCVDSIMARSAAGFVGVSASCVDSLTVRPALKGCRKRVIYNGIEPFTPRPTSSLLTELGLPAGTRIVLMLAVYEPRKGHEFMFQAMQDVVAKIPDVCLLVCGDGTETEIEAVRDLRRRSSVQSHIVLQGHRSDVANLMAQVQLLVMPSQTHESFGYTVVEAMACSLPVVVTDVGGLPEVVEDGTTGYVVPRKDVGEFAEKIVRLLGDDALRRHMGQMGLKRFEEHFLADRMTREYVALLDGHLPVGESPAA